VKKARPYSLQTKLAALVALERNDGNVFRTAREIGISVVTLRSWRKAQREGRLVLPAMQPELPDDASLDERLEQIVQQMVAIMPEKLENASLHELVRSLAMVRATMNEARAEKEESSDVYEKLARLMDRYAAAEAAGGNPEPTDQN
jgi:transposase-like protein